MQGADDSREVLERYQGELDLVELIVSQVVRAVGRTADEEDLMSAGREGLFDAARKFDTSYGIPFRAYANLRVRGAVIDGVRRQSRVPRRAHERLAALAASAAVTEGGLAWAHSDENLPAGEAESRFKGHVAAMITAATVACVTDQSGQESCEEVATPEEQLAQAEILDLIRRHIDALLAGEAAVLRAYYFENQSLAEIAERFGYSRSWACRLHTRAISQLTELVRGSM